MKVTAENWAEVLLKKNEAKAFYQNLQPQDLIHCINNSERIDDLPDLTYTIDQFGKDRAFLVWFEQEKAICLIHHVNVVKAPDLESYKPTMSILALEGLGKQATTYSIKASDLMKLKGISSPTTKSLKSIGLDNYIADSLENLKADKNRLCRLSSLMWIPPIMIRSFTKQESNGPFSPSEIFSIVRDTVEEMQNLEAKKFNGSNL